MSLHRCTYSECPYLGKPSTKGCACHLTDEHVLLLERETLIAALRTLAGNAGALRAFEHDIRDAAGNTNWQCLMDAVADADAAIAKATGAA